jgi:hypothetical protein
LNLDVGEAYLIFEKISVLPKVFSTNSPNRLKTLPKCFGKTLSVLAEHLSVLQNTLVFCHTPNNCYHICTYCYANNRKYSMKDDLHPQRPPPLPLSALSSPLPCHGCRIAADIAADIAAVAVAAATATAAAVSAATTVSAVIAAAFWLIVVCPRAASATATVACPRPRRCRCWLRTPLPLVPQPQTAAPCPLLLPPQPLPQLQLLFSLVMFNILHRLFAATFWLIVVCPRAAYAFVTITCPCCCAFANLLVIVAMCATSPASCLS